MPLSSLDVRPALIVIDLQKGVVALPMIEPTADIVSRSARLAEAFRGRGLPVVLVNVAGRRHGRTDAGTPTGTPPADWTDIVPELGPEPGDHLVTKYGWSAFHGTGLDEHLRGLGATQIVLCGIATSLGVESTARAAHELGYHVVLVADAMTDLTSEAHSNSLERIFPRLGETTTTGELLTAIQSR